MDVSSRNSLAEGSSYLALHTGPELMPLSERPTAESDVVYCARRAREERKLVQTCGAARRAVVHAEIAERYENLVVSMLLAEGPATTA